MRSQTGRVQTWPSTFAIKELIAEPLEQPLAAYLRESLSRTAADRPIVARYIDSLEDIPSIVVEQSPLEGKDLSSVTAVAVAMVATPRGPIALVVSLAAVLVLRVLWQPAGALSASISDRIRKRIPPR